MLVSVSVSGPVCLVWPFLSVFLVRSALSEFGRGGGFYRRRLRCLCLAAVYLCCCLGVGLLANILRFS